MPAPAIQIRELNKTYKQHQVLKDLSLDLPAGKLSVLLGRSGSGKSTLLRCLSGLEEADLGSQVQVQGACGMVFQQFHLFPHLTVTENLLLAPRVAQGREDEAALEKEAQALLAKVGLSFHAGHYPSQLSGGQQQRAAIARALMVRPQILLYDEPTSALDPDLSEEVLAVMRELRKEGLTQVMVTHEHPFARKYADWVVVLENGELIEQGTPAKVFGKPKDARTRAFLRSAA
jgi:ABC-type polar amino acid transport system ATPase subunit